MIPRGAIRRTWPDSALRPHHPGQQHQGDVIYLGLWGREGINRGDQGILDLPGRDCLPARYSPVLHSRDAAAAANLFAYLPFLLTFECGPV